ncbi:NAD(P)-dependent oxidoreductase [Occultella kanbiaonis]|uniref:NAD(P)-dependent oxidoreductase n=1 Tax=Occultella kanbiaonis TaxID=2675754 RepID=UPI0013D6C6BA|nr:NAD(P)H-binding protein [Occultella kanbiaonis]
MSAITVFGAGGRAGRRTVAEALRRGYDVTAVVRDLAGHPDLLGSAADVVAGDVRAADPDLAIGRTAVISAAAAYGDGSDPAAFFEESSAALLAAARAADARLVVVGLSVLLSTAAGQPLLDTLELPAEFASFALAHGSGLATLRRQGGDVDWLYVSPGGDFDHQGERTGGYRIVETGDMGLRISYEDLAVAVLDEVERPAHRRVHLAVTGRF